MGEPAGAEELLRALCAVIDAHDWDGMGPLLTEDFECRLVHTGERFDREGWVRLNADYPGFERMVVADLVGSGNRAAVRCHVTGRAGDGTPVAFEVAGFATAHAGRISELTEIWTDVDQSPPEGTRPE